MLKKEIPSLIRFTLLVLLLVAARFASHHLEGTGPELYNLDNDTETVVSERSLLMQATR